MPIDDAKLDLEVWREDLRRARVHRSPTPAPSPGEALLRVERFGCTANNITYAVLGDAVHYWDFFPAADGWGRIPAWGFAEVIESASEALERGARVFGYCPMSTHMVLTPGRAHDSGFADASPHRADLPAAYNAYRRVDADPGHDAGREDQQILLRPVFFLSFLLDDYLADSDDFGADAIVLSSASSKTALGAAFLLGERGAEAIGLTSAANVEFLERLGIYDRVVRYDAVETLPDRAIVFVDVAGNESVRRDVHRHHDAGVRHSALVGAAHWEQRPAAGDAPDSEPLPGATPTWFFTPDRLRVRTREWGPPALDARVNEALRRFVSWCDGWLRIERAAGPDAARGAYLQVLEGGVRPDVGHVLTMWPE